MDEELIEKKPKGRFKSRLYLSFPIAYVVLGCGYLWKGIFGSGETFHIIIGILSYFLAYIMYIALMEEV